MSHAPVPPSRPLCLLHHNHHEGRWQLQPPTVTHPQGDGQLRIHVVAARHLLFCVAAAAAAEEAVVVLRCRRRGGLLAVGHVFRGVQDAARRKMHRIAREAGAQRSRGVAGAAAGGAVVTAAFALCHVLRLRYRDRQEADAQCNRHNTAAPKAPAEFTAFGRQA